MRIVFMTLAIVLLDQLVKQLVLRWFDLPFWLIDQQLGFSVALNPGIAFSLPIRGLLSVFVSLVVILALIVYYLKSTRKILITDVAFGLVIGGALGNLIDRLHQGAVIDYIHIFSYPAFNIADAAIVIGFLIFVFRFDKMRL